MGLLDWFRRKKTTPAKPKPAKASATGAKPVAPPVAAAAAKCSAMTASGARCSRSAGDNSNLCGIHQRAAAAGTKKVAAGAATAAPKRTAAKAATNGKQCGAITAAGAQCSRQARARSDYCGLHKGYQPPAKKAAVQANDTKPTVNAAKDTKPKARRAQITKYGYKLYQNGNRFFFSKKAQKDVTGNAVYVMPKGKQVVRTPNGLPVLKNK